MLDNQGNVLHVIYATGCSLEIALEALANSNS